MVPGRILYLNGVTSAGKSTLAEVLKNQKGICFFALSNEMLQNTVGQTRLRADYWTHLAEAIRMLYRTARLYSQQGKHVVIDGMLLECPGLSPHLETVREILAGCPLDFVEVSCPTEVLRSRNAERADRYILQSEEQAAMMARDIPYSCRVETDKNTPEECAQIVLERLAFNEPSAIRYDKLVRDKIPDIIRGEGKTAVCAVLSAQEMQAHLACKLCEEAEEYRASLEAEELADVLEVLYAIAVERGISRAELEALRARKAETRGGFASRILLREVKDERIVTTQRRDP